MEQPTDGSEAGGARAGSEHGAQLDARIVPKVEASKFVFSWLKANFTEKQSSLLPRKWTYEVYRSYCAFARYEPTTQAAFGKIFKKAFPLVGMRRLAPTGDKQRYYEGVEFTPQVEFQYPELQPISSRPTKWVEENGFTKEAQGEGKRKRRHNLTTLKTESEVGSQESDVQSFGSTEQAFRRPIHVGRRNSSNAVGTMSHRRSSFKNQLQTEVVVHVNPVNVHLAVNNELAFYCNFYVKEMYGLNPLNPLLTSAEYLAEGLHSLESTSLALSGCVLMTGVCFLSSQFDKAEHYFHMARHHLGELFDTSDYDVACVLTPLSWWSRFYATDEEDGQRKEQYYVMLGRRICEAVSAVNDETYWNLVRLQMVHSMKDPTDIIERSKQQPRYQKSWRPVNGLTHNRDDYRDSAEVRGMVARLFGSVYPLCTFYQQGDKRRMKVERYDDEWIKRRNQLQQSLGVAIRLEELLLKHIRADRFCTRLYTMMQCEVAAMRVFILWALRSEQQSYAAKNFIQLLLKVPSSIMVLASHELSSNDYLLLRLPVDILVQDGDVKLLYLLHDAMQPYTKRFYWMRHFCGFMRQRLTLGTETETDQDLEALVLGLGDAESDNIEESMPLAITASGSSPSSSSPVDISLDRSALFPS